MQCENEYEYDDDYCYEDYYDDVELINQSPWEEEQEQKRRER